MHFIAEWAVHRWMNMRQLSVVVGFEYVGSIIFTHRNPVTRAKLVKPCWAEMPSHRFYKLQFHPYRLQNANLLDQSRWGSLFFQLEPRYIHRRHKFRDKHNQRLRFHPLRFRSIHGSFHILQFQGWLHMLDLSRRCSCRSLLDPRHIHRHYKIRDKYNQRLTLHPHRSIHSSLHIAIYLHRIYMMNLGMWGTTRTHTRLRAMIHRPSIHRSHKFRRKCNQRLTRQPRRSIRSGVGHHSMWINRLTQHTNHCRASCTFVGYCN